MSGQVQNRNLPLAVVGGVIAMSGLIRGFVAVVVAGVDCGSVFSPEFYGEYVIDEICAADRGRVTPWVWILILGGIAILIWGLYDKKPRNPYSQFGLVLPEQEMKDAQLKDAVALRDAGTLTEEQFQTVKSRLANEPLDDSSQKLADLYAAGVLTEAEFQQARDRLR